MLEYTFLLGGYTDAATQGIYRIRYNPTQELFSTAELLSASHNPSIGLKNGRLWYWVEEAQPGKIHVFDAENNWQHLASVECGGASPCHLALDQDGRYLAVANYMGGSISIFALDTHGLPLPGPCVLQHQGRGPTARQEAPHAHYVAFAMNNAGQPGIYAVDLGLDQVIWYPQLQANQWGVGTVVLQAQPGDGPRHFAIHPTNGRVYLLNELSNSLSVINIGSDGQWNVQQRISTLPEAYVGDTIAAHISISRDGEFIYTSNRGHHSIAVFKIQPDGELSLIQIEPCGGEWPRYFALIEDAARLIVAHEHSNSLAAFVIGRDGRLQPTQAQGAVLKPTFVGLA